MLTRLALVTASAVTAVFAAGHIPANPVRAALPDVPRHTSPGKSFAVPAVRGPVSYYLSRDTTRSANDVRLIILSGDAVAVPRGAVGSYHLLACSGSGCASSRSLVSVR